MENLFVLPTDKPSRLIKNNHSQLLLTIQTLPLDREICCFPQNIYITSAEEIKDGEYGLSRLGEIIKFHSGYDYRYYAKIILTTDVDLIANGVQAIDDEFLEWFVKNPSCELVEIDSTCKCVTCNSSVKSSCDYAYKCRPQIFYKIIIPKEEPKQETLEEIVNKLSIKEAKDLDLFLKGAKWQQERMYIDIEVFTEELKDKIDSFEYSVNQNSYISDYIKQWFEQFKNK